MGDPENALPGEAGTRRLPGVTTTLCVSVFVLFAGIAYMGSLAGFVRWEERAPTQVEYIRRCNIRCRFFAPLTWLKARDRSGVLNAVVQWEYRMFRDRSFDPNRLPREIARRDASHSQ